MTPIYDKIPRFISSPKDLAEFAMLVRPELDVDAAQACVELLMKHAPYTWWEDWRPWLLDVGRHIVNTFTQFINQEGLASFHINPTIKIRW